MLISNFSRVFLSLKEERDFMSDQHLSYNLLATLELPKYSNLQFFFFQNFVHFLFFCLFFEARFNEMIDAADWFDNSPYFWSSKKKIGKQNLETINWRIWENKLEKTSHEWVIKSKFVCTCEVASDWCSAPSSVGDVKLMLPSTSVSSNKSWFSGSSTGLKSGFNLIVPGSGPSGISSGVTFMVKTTLSMDLKLRKRDFIPNVSNYWHDSLELW